MIGYRIKPKTQALVAATESGQKETSGDSIGAASLRQGIRSRDE